MPTPALAASTAARAMPTTKVSEIFMTVTREGGRGGLQKPPAWPPVRISADSYKAGPSDYGACLPSCCELPPVTANHIHRAAANKSTFATCTRLARIASKDAAIHGIRGSADMKKAGQKPAFQHDATAPDFRAARFQSGWSSTRSLAGRRPAARTAVRRSSARSRRRSEEHTSELQSLMRNSYAVFCSTQK